MRVELFDIEIESLRSFSTFTQRSLGDDRRVEIAPAAELAAEHRELAEIAALRRRRAPRRRRAAAGRPLPRRCSTCPAGAERGHRRRGGGRADAARPLAGRLRRLPRRRRPPPLRRARGDRGALDARARVRLQLDHRRPADRAPRPGRRPRRALAERGRARAREARALGLPHGRHLAAARRRRARRATTSRACRRAGSARRPPQDRCVRPGARCATGSSPPGCASR